MAMLLIQNLQTQKPLGNCRNQVNCRYANLARKNQGEAHFDGIVSNCSTAAAIV